MKECLCCHQVKEDKQFQWIWALLNFGGDPRGSFCHDCLAKLKEDTNGNQERDTKA